MTRDHTWPSLPVVEARARRARLHEVLRGRPSAEPCAGAVTRKLVVPSLTPQVPPATPTAEPFPGKRVPEAPRAAPDATRVRPLRKLSRFWRAGAETCSSCCGPRRATKGSFTVRPTCHLTVWSGHRFLGSLLTHPHPPCTGGLLSSPEHNHPCGQNRARPRCVNMTNRPRSELA